MVGDGGAKPEVPPLAGRARLPASTRFDDLIPPWLFCVRHPAAQAATAVGLPAAVTGALVAVGDPTDVRFGPLLALAAIVVAATCSWQAALVAGVEIELAYWWWGVPPRGSFDFQSGGSAASVAAMAILAGGLAVLTRRIEQTVDEVRELDVQRQHDLQRSDALANQLAAALRAGTALATCETRAEVAEVLLRSVSLPEPPTAGGVAMVEGQRLRLLAARGSSPELVARLEGADLTASSWLADVLSGRPVFVERRDDFAAQHPAAEILELFPSGSWVVLPFRTAGSFGLLSVHYAAPQPLHQLEAYFFLLAELLATSLARAGAEEARLTELHHLEQSFAERDRIARTLSTSLIPPVLPELGGFQAAGWLEPASADEVAGDFYDLFPVEGDWVAVLGDVAGKGAEAAAVTSLARYAARAAALSTPRPLEVVDLVDRALSADPSDLLCTVAVVRYAGAQQEVEVALAGHHLARVVTSTGVRRVGAYGSAAGLGLGSFRADVAPFGPGDLLVLFSDGLIERDPAFGDDELDRVLAAGPRDPGALVEHLRRAVADLEPLHPDDIAVLVVQRT